MFIHVIYIYTSFGRYTFFRLPYGIPPAAEVFSRKFQDIFKDIDNCEPYGDDLIIWGKYKQKHDHRLGLLLKKAREQNIIFKLCKLNLRKAQ